MVLLTQLHTKKVIKSKNLDETNMASTVISIQDCADQKIDHVAPKEKKMFRFRFSLPCCVTENKRSHDMRKIIHSVKVGMALVLVSLLYLLDPLYDQVGDSAMWAIMTVVVIFEFFAGAVLSKGLNRGIGTVLGGGLGCLAAAFAQDFEGTNRAIVVGFFVLVCGAGATYSRFVPSIKKTCDYAALIFILTFNLVVVSGLRAERVMQLARERLSTIFIGFAVTISMSLLVFPMWASDELHESTASKFEDLAKTIEGCLEEYFRFVSEKEYQPRTCFKDCKSVLHSKAKDESLASFARWEPWHGRFGLSHPWNQYLQIGEILRDLAATILSLKSCLQSARQPSSTVKQTIKEPCEDVGSAVVWSLRELGESITKMRRSQVVEPKPKSLRLELNEVMSQSKRGLLKNGEELAMGSFVFLLMEIAEKVEELAKEVEKLGGTAGFHSK